MTSEGTRHEGGGWRESEEVDLHCGKTKCTDDHDLSSTESVDEEPSADGPYETHGDGTQVE